MGYGNGVDTTGQGGPSNLVEYDIATGAVLKNISIPGHLDGLKINPATGDVWATENEDGNPTLAVVDHESGAFKIFKFDPSLITGGMDDLVFVTAKGDDSRRDGDGPDVFIVASSQVDTTTPVIVQIAGRLRATNTRLTATVPGAPATVWNVVTNTAETTDQIGDPDSMTLDPAGELVLDNRSDDSLYIIRDPKAEHPILRVPLTLGGAAVEVNDTIFTTSQTNGVSSTAGTIFITDTSAKVEDRKAAIELLAPRKLSDFAKTLQGLLDDAALRGTAIRALVEGEGGGPRLKAMLFRAKDGVLAETLLGVGGNAMALHLAGHLRAEEWSGVLSPSFSVADMAVA